MRKQGVLEKHRVPHTQFRHKNERAKAMESMEDIMSGKLCQLLLFHILGVAIIWRQLTKSSFRNDFIEKRRVGRFMRILLIT